MDKFRKRAQKQIDKHVGKPSVVSAFALQFERWQKDPTSRPAKSVGDYITNVLACVEHLRDTILQPASALGYKPKEKEESKSGNPTTEAPTTDDLGGTKKVKRDFKADQDKKGPAPVPVHRVQCNGCGREHVGGFKECRHKTHPILLGCHLYLARNGWPKMQRLRTCNGPHPSWIPRGNHPTTKGRSKDPVAMVPQKILNEVSLRYMSLTL